MKESGVETRRLRCRREFVGLQSEDITRKRFTIVDNNANNSAVVSGTADGYGFWKGMRVSQFVNNNSPRNFFAQNCISGSSSAVRVLLCKSKVTSCGSLTSVGKPDKMGKVEDTMPKKGCKVVIEDEVEIAAQSIKAYSRRQVTPKPKGKSEEAEDDVIGALVTDVPVRKSPRKRQIKSEEPIKDAKRQARRKVEVEEKLGEESVDKRVKKKGNYKVEEDEEEEVEEEVNTKKVKRRGKTKEEKEAETVPLAARSSIQTLKKAMYIGAHVSGAGGVHNSISNAVHIGGNSFALFLKSQRKWTSPPLADEARDQFLAFSEQHNYDCSKHVVPHGSYLVNLAHLEPDKAEQAFTCFLDDVQRCEVLGIKLYNFHPGNTGPHPRAEAIGRIAANLNKAHKATKSVVTVLENMAGGGNVIGSTFEDLRDIISLIDDKSRVGVCIDTCHSFAAGYDLRTPAAFKKTMDSFSEIVGMKYLKALHINDSKAPFSSKRDLHANIGTGFLGLRAFHNVVNFEPFQDLPLVLETPIDKKGKDGKVVEDKGVWAAEIKLLEGLIGADAESEEFKAEEQRLQDLGAEERKKFQQQVDKKVQKTIDAMFKKASPKKKKVKAEDDEPRSDGESDGQCNH